MVRYLGTHQFNEGLSMTSLFKSILIVSTFIFIASYMSVCVSGETLEEKVESKFLVKGILDDLSSSQKTLREKPFFPVVPPYPSRSDIEGCDRIVSDNLWILTNTWHKLIFSCGIKNVKFPQRVDEREIEWQRKDKTEIFLALLQTVRKTIDPEFDPNVPIEMNVVPIPDKTDDTGQFFLPGMLAERIKHPQTRRNYEKACWENAKNSFLKRIHNNLNKLILDTESSFRRHVRRTYLEDSNTHQELIDLLEKYEYPEVERIKLLCDLKIPYKNFRQWQSTNDLFKATAKFVSLTKDEVTLEKADGKRTTIELSTLRKEDQDYVKAQQQAKP